MLRVEFENLRVPHFLGDYVLRQFEIDLWLQMYGNLKAFLGTANLDTITAVRVEECQQHRVRAVSPATVNRQTDLLKHMFNMAER